MQQINIVIFTIILTVVLSPLILTQYAEASHPKNLEATPQNESVDLSWSVSRISIVSDFIIQYKLSDDSDWSVFSDGTNNNTFATVTGLINGESYDFKITAKYSTSRSDRTTSSESATPNGSITITVNPPTALETHRQDGVVILTWEKPTPTPTDYVIQYKKNFERSYTTLTDGVNTKTIVKITGLDNERNYEFKVASKIGNISSIFTDVITATPSERCATIGADEIAERCYATQTLYIKSKYQEKTTGFSGTINFDEVTLPGGFNNAPYWLIFTIDDDDRAAIIEIGIIDNNYGTPKLFCAEDGIQQTTKWNAVENATYNIDVTKKSSSVMYDIWGLIINGNVCDNIQVTRGSVPTGIKMGTETSFNNPPDFTQEFDDSKLKIIYPNGRIIPYLLQSGLGVVGMPEIEPGFFIDKCGNSREGFYHIETGKGVSGIC